MYFQCESGHLICKNCLCDPAFVDKRCGICRRSLRHASRNRIAEIQLRNRSVECPENGCNEILNYEKLEEHLTSECQYVEQECKYKKLGCNWSGPRNLQDNHEHINIDFDELLQRIENDDKKIEELMEENEDFQDMAQEKDREMDDIRKSFDIFLKSNITKSFRFFDIWKDFNLNCLSPAPQVVKHIGDITEGICLKLYFRIFFPKHEQRRSRNMIIMQCQVTGNAINEHQGREIFIRLDYVALQDDDALVQMRDIPIMFKYKFEKTFQSQWHGFTYFIQESHQEESMSISEADKIVMTRPTGNIKIFAWIY